MAKVSFHGRELEMSDLSRVMLSGEDVLKGDVLNYYFRLAPTLTPHLQGRLVATRPRAGDVPARSRGRVRSDPTPAWMQADLVDGLGLGGPCMVVREHAALAYLVQQTCVTPYASLSVVTALDRPDRVVFDIDPPDACPSAFAEVCEAALTLRRALENRGLVPFVMTSGSRGLHVHAPLRPTQTVETVLGFAYAVAQDVVSRDRCRYALAGSDPGGKITIDHRRNGRGQLVVAPYGLRALPGAPVATPLQWNELHRMGPNPTHHTIASVFGRLAHGGDPWRDIGRSARSLPWERSGLATPATHVRLRGRDADVRRRDRIAAGE